MHMGVNESRQNYMTAAVDNFISLIRFCYLSFCSYGNDLAFVDCHSLAFFITHTVSLHGKHVVSFYDHINLFHGLTPLCPLGKRGHHAPAVSA